MLFFVVEITLPRSFGAEFLEFRVVTRFGGRSARRAGLRRGSEREIVRPRARGADGGGDGIGRAMLDANDNCAVVWRRFSAFRQLHYDVMAVLRGSHLLDSLPPLPGIRTTEKTKESNHSTFILQVMLTVLNIIYMAIAFYEMTNWQR